MPSPAPTLPLRRPCSQVSLLRAQARPPPQPLTPAEGGGGDLEFDPAAWRAAGGGPRLTASRQPTPAARSFGLWGERQPWWGVSGGGRGGRGVHPFVRDPPSLAVLSAFRQVLKNTQGIVIDSGKGWSCPARLLGRVGERGAVRKGEGAALAPAPLLAHGVPRPLCFADRLAMRMRRCAAPSQANVHIWSRGLLSGDQTAGQAREALGGWQAMPACLAMANPHAGHRHLAMRAYQLPYHACRP